MKSSSEKNAVLIMAYGSPDSLEDVEPYLKDVRGGRETSPELVEEIRSRYAAIGGKSPLLEITLRQGRALEKELNKDIAGNTQVFIGMKHWQPTIKDAVAQIAGLGITRMTALCMTPFFSQMSTGAYFTRLEQAVAAEEMPSTWRERLSIRKIGSWFNDPTFIHASARNLNDCLIKNNHHTEETPLVLFTAHSLPAVLTDKGDPYAGQFMQLCHLVADETGLGAKDWSACYQSAGGGNLRWLGPSLEETLQQVASEGRKSVLVAPIGFLCDHVEILYDIDIEARRIASRFDIQLSRVPSLNDHPALITALADIVRSDAMTL